MSEHDSPSAVEAPRGLATGRLIGGRYRLVAPLAEGGMGSVWRAEHETLGHAVAVKLLAGGSAASKDHQARFEREARLAARIAEDSLHVVKVTDHGVHDDGTPWLVMELLHGEALDKRLKRDGRLPLSVAAEIVRQVARGLEVAHRHGVVHRDLKPANVFLCSDLAIDDVARRDGIEEVHAKILDFGVAKSMWDDDDAPTREGVVLGTPGYMSPEQLDGSAPVDARTDVWALGAIAYRMIAGRPAFGVGTTREIAARIAGSQPTPPSHLVPGVPAEVDAVLARALAKDPSARWASARELGDALHRAISLATAPQEGQLATGDGVVAAPRVDRTPKRRVLFVAAGALLSLFALLFALRTRNDAPAAPVSPATSAKGERRSDVVVPEVASAPKIVMSSTEKEVVVAVPSASAAKPGPFVKPRKVIDTWHKKDEL